MAHDQDPGRDLDTALSGVSASRRSFLQGIIAGTAYVAPRLASFSLAALAAEPAMAQSSNLS